MESGTYQERIDEVEADKSEIYVETEDNERLELYFTECSTFTRDGKIVSFDQLKEGGKVEAEVGKVGQRLDPIAVS